jgi:hypothetical protein
VSGGQGRLSVPPGSQIQAKSVINPEMDEESRETTPDQPMDESHGSSVNSTIKLMMSADFHAAHDCKCCLQSLHEALTK